MSGSAYPGRQRPRPDLYSGTRRRFSGVGTIASGFVALVLVLGALLTSELDHYADQDDPSLNSHATGSARVPTGAAPAAPDGGNAARDGGNSVAPAAPGGSPGPSGTPSSAPTADVVGAAVLKTINAELADLGCAPVTLEPALIAAARNHMTTMVTTGYLNLRAPDGTRPDDRAEAAGFSGKRVVESIVLGADTAQEAATIGFPDPGQAGEALPITVQVVARSTLMCGYTSLGADYRRDSRNVPIWSIIVGTR